MENDVDRCFARVILTQTFPEQRCIYTHIWVCIGMKVLFLETQEFEGEKGLCYRSVAQSAID